MTEIRVQCRKTRRWTIDMQMTLEESPRGDYEICKKITKIVNFRKVVDENKRRNVSEVGTYFLNHFQYFWQ